MVSSVNGSRINPPVDPIADKTVERARREFMEAVRSGDRQTRQAIEAVRDETDRAGSDPQPGLRRDLERPRAGQGSIVHLETARGPERGPDRRSPDDTARREAMAAGLRRQEVGRQDVVRQEVGRQDLGRQDSGRQDVLGHDAARQQGLGQDSLRSDSRLAGTRPSTPPLRRDAGIAPVDAVVARIPTGRPRPEPIGPPPPPGYHPPPPVAPAGTVLIGPVPGREALNLVGPTEAPAGAVSAFGSLRLSSTTPREVAQRIAGFMETGKLDTSPVRFAPVSAVLSGDDDAEPEESGRRNNLTRPEPGAESSALAGLGDDVRALAAT